MKGEKKSSGNKTARMELKYCEHCGGLWLRECGAGTVYCGNCQAKVADLPIPKKKPGRVTLPVRDHTKVEEYNVEVEDDGVPDIEASGWDVSDRDAAGGAA